MYSSQRSQELSNVILAMWLTTHVMVRRAVALMVGLTSLGMSVKKNKLLVVVSNQNPDSLEVQSYSDFTLVQGGDSFISFRTTKDFREHSFISFRTSTFSRI